MPRYFPCGQTRRNALLKMTCCLTMIVCSYNARCPGDDLDELRGRFLNEYPPAALELETFYRNHLAIQFHRVDSNRTLSHYHYSATPQMMRVDKTVVGSGTASHVINRDAMFTAVRSLNDSAFHLPTLVALKPQKRRDLELTTVIPFAAYSVYERRISEFLADTDVEITGVTVVANDDSEVFQIDWRRNNSGLRSNDGTPGTQTGWFLLEPDKNWICRGFAIRYSQDASGMRKVDIAYSSTPERIPMIDSVKEYIENIDTHERKLIATTEVDSVSFEKIPEQHFQLSAFDLSESLAVPPASKVP